MNAAQFQKMLRRLGFAGGSLHPNDQGLAEFARWLPVDRGTVLRWLVKDEIPEPVAKLMAVMDRRRVSPRRAAAYTKEMGARLR